ncbi:MAG: hypothetical protein WA751_10980, partial [Candidatus Dormiibacterota bacterium]
LGSDPQQQGASTMEMANQILAKHLPRHNRQFTVAAQDSAAAWRPRPRELDQLFCFSSTGWWPSTTPCASRPR